MPLAIGIRPEQGSLPRESPSAVAPGRKKVSVFPGLLADERIRAATRKDPPPRRPRARAGLRFPLPH